jgi:hypothetical protein
MWYPYQVQISLWIVVSTQKSLCINIPKIKIQTKMNMKLYIFLFIIFNQTKRNQIIIIKKMVNNKSTMAIFPIR